MDDNRFTDDNEGTGTLNVPGQEGIGDVNAVPSDTGDDDGNATSDDDGNAAPDDGGNAAPDDDGNAAPGDGGDAAPDDGDDSAEPDDSGGSGDNNKFWMEFYEWAQYIFAMVICAIFISVFIGRQIGVEGESMFPTLHWYDKIIISNLFYQPEYGDIIVFQPSTNTFHGTPLVKRVIAVEGQKVDINFETGEVSVDGNVLNEPYINELTHRSGDFTGPIVVPEGHIFVMGDNRNRSSDSRFSSVGFVDTRSILGKVLFLIIPGSDETNPRDWSRIGNVYG